LDTVREVIRVQPEYIGEHQLTARHGSEGETRGDYIVDVVRGPYTLSVVTGGKAAGWWC